MSLRITSLMRIQLWCRISHMWWKKLCSVSRCRMLFDVIKRLHVDAHPTPPPILEKIINDSNKNYEQPPQFHRNPIVQKEVEFVVHLILQGKDKDIPFTPYLSKCQKKKALKDVYHTRSRDLHLLTNEDLLHEYHRSRQFRLSNYATFRYCLVVFSSSDFDGRLC